MDNVPKWLDHFKNLAANTARFSKCVWPFWDIMHWKVKSFEGLDHGKVYEEFVDYQTLRDNDFPVEAS